MKKVFLGGTAACSIHFEKDMIKMYFKDNEEFKITNDYKEADLIVIIDSCMATYENLLNTMKFIEDVLNTKKTDATVVVSGCFAKGVKFELTEEQKNILKQVKCIPSDEIIEYIMKCFNLDFPEEYIEDFKLPYRFNKYGLSTTIVDGCLNHCSFCKTNYMNFELKSKPFELLEKTASDIEEMPIHHISLSSSNLSLYGVDLYGKQRCHEAIKLLTSPSSIKFADAGALINWYPELVMEILENEKIKTIFISLESGSERIYKLMNRPISLQELTEIIKLIRENRPDIIIQTEIITGYPTETFDDLKRSIELIHELDIMPVFLNAYKNSIQVPSSALHQHSPQYCQESTRYAYEKLYGIHCKFCDVINSSDMYILKKYEKYKIYAVMLIDGNIRYVRFDQLDTEYDVGDMISANTIKPKQLVKRKK